MSNARIEATNNKIKLIIRKAYDFRNIQNMPDMVYLVCSDLRVPLPNRRLKTAWSAQLPGLWLIFIHYHPWRALILIHEWHLFHICLLPNPSFLKSEFRQVISDGTIFKSHIGSSSFFNASIGIFLNSATFLYSSENRSTVMKWPLSRDSHKKSCFSPTGHICASLTASGRSCDHWKVRAICVPTMWHLSDPRF